MREAVGYSPHFQGRGDRGESGPPHVKDEATKRRRKVVSWQML